MAADNIRPFRNSAQEPPDDPEEPYYDQDPDDGKLKRFRLQADNEDMEKWTDICWNAVIAWNHSEAFSNSPRVYTRDGALVELQWVKSKRRGKMLRIKVVDRDIMMAILGRCTQWFKTVGKREVERLPHVQVASSMYKRPDERLPVLTRIVAAPVFSHDAKLSTDPGYNADSETFYQEQDGISIPDVPTNPTDEDVDRAKAWLWQVIEEFPFVDQADITHAYSLMLNPFVRDMIETPTPMYMIEAPERGTGKGYLSEACLWAALGKEPPTLIMTDDAEEVRKRLFTIASSGPEAIVLDNIDKVINSGGLATALSTQVSSDRRMATQDMGEAEIRNTWVATGNNPKMNGDIFRRTVRIRLDAKRARPEERTFKKDIKRFVRQHRPDLIWSCLVMVQNWIAKGMPDPEDNGATLGGFEGWARVHGGILEAACIFGFLSNRNDTESLSNEEQSYPIFVEEWFKRHKLDRVSASDLLGAAESVPGFPLRGFDHHKRSTNLGITLATIHNRVYGELRVTRSGRNGWALERVEMELF